MRKPKSLTAFTLTELLIATAIFSIVILSMYSAMHAGILSYRKIDSASCVYQIARVIFNRMESDLKNSFVYAKDDAHFKGAKETLEFFTSIDSYDQEGNVSTNVCRVKYALTPDGKLMRTCFKGLQALEENLNLEGDELSADIKEIILQYAYKTNDADDPFVWKDNTDEHKDSLPLAVKIELTGDTFSFTKTVSLVR